MSDRCGVSTAQRHGLLDCRTQPRMAVRPHQREHLDHLARTARFAVPLDELVEQPIITGWPQAFRAPAGERLRSRQRARLALQHVEVMLQFQNLLLTSVAAFMAGEAAALVA